MSSEGIASVLELQRLAGNKAVQQLITVQRDDKDSGDAKAALKAAYDKGYADGRAGNPENPLLVWNDEAMASYRSGWSAGNKEAERTHTSAAPDEPVLLESANTGSSSAATTAQGDTTDVDWPPPRPDISVPKRTLVVTPGAHPPAEEVVPPLGIDTGLPFWGVAQVGPYVEKLTAGWASRTASNPAAKVPTAADFQTDFKESMEGWYARSSFQTTWPGVPAAALNELKSTRATLAKTLAQPKGRTPGLKGDDLDAAIEANMVVKRQNIVDRVQSHLIEGAWGWMRERRDHLDFSTLRQTGVAELKGLDPTALVTTAQERSAIHAAAQAKGKALTDDDAAKTISDALAAKRKKLEAAQKKKGKNAAPVSDDDAALTDEEKQDAITAKEKARLGADAQKAVDQLRKANLSAEQATWVDVHERDADGKRRWGNVWEESLTKTKEVDRAHSSIGVMRQVADLVLRLESATGGGFTASNYHGHGGGSFLDRGRSVDLAIPHTEASGFFDPQAAVDFLLKLDGVADVEWRVLYDDYRVAKAVNEKLGKRRVSETANTSTDKTGTITNVNWHGPLVTHFHLDLAY